MHVARTLINPFGGVDDEDFEMEYLIDRNFQVGYLMVKSDEDEDDEDINNDVDDIDDCNDKDIPLRLADNLKEKVPEVIQGNCVAEAFHDAKEKDDDVNDVSPPSYNLVTMEDETKTQ